MHWGSPAHAPPKERPMSHLRTSKTYRLLLATLSSLLLISTIVGMPLVGTAGAQAPDTGVDLVDGLIDTVERQARKGAQSVEPAPLVVKGHLKQRIRSYFTP